MTRAAAGTSSTPRERAPARAKREPVVAREQPAPIAVAAAPGADAAAILFGLERVGDSAVLVDREREEAVQGTAAVVSMLSSIGAPTVWPSPLGRWELALPGLTKGLREVGAQGACDAPAEREQGEPNPRWRVGAAGEFAVEAVALDARWLVLRLHDEAGRQREQRETLRRQLNDREGLLFTSRSLSVGEVGSVLAHELKQPIGAVANLLRGLRLRAVKRGGHESELAAIERAIDQVTFASQVITRIREFTHARTPQLAALELGGLLRHSASLLDWDCQRQGVRLLLDLPTESMTVNGDATMLQQVVANLMRNALDAMRDRPPAQPRVTVGMRREGSDVVVDVADNGAGMSAQAEQRLFVPFTSSKPTGLGIGLSICRSFVELHQGKLWFSRNDDGGCTFHVRLPLETPGGDIQGVRS
jgi:two-component system, LuxR family, sensor kinase FixL